jgi:hypothetical protein
MAPLAVRGRGAKDAAALAKNGVRRSGVELAAVSFVSGQTLKVATMRQDHTWQECVFHALAASDAAEKCAEPDLRAAFLELAEDWLNKADRAAAASDTPALQ